jgi:cholesterol oxidase
VPHCENAAAVSTSEVSLPDFDYDAVVIGSGFGGAVTAYRLAAAGERVCVLERGKAYPPGSFPRSPYDLSRSFWDPSEGHYGLYNVWSFKGLGALVCSGLGGGSLIYANVLLRKDADTFVQDEHEVWPLGYEDLEEHYERAEEILNGQRYPLEHDPYNRTRKTLAMRAAGEGLPERLGIPGVAWQRPKLAITFANPGEDPRPGVEIRDAPPSSHDEPHARLTCVLSGECDLGCNYGSKNSLDLNYLGLAKQQGAVMRACCEVTAFSPADEGYRVAFVDHGELAEKEIPRRELPEQRITTRRLVLAAGTLGSTFLLLKCRKDFPALSNALGTRFSGNGDLLTFLVKAHARGGGPRLLEASYGPVITSAIRVPSDGGKRRGHYIQDAGYPYLVSWLTQSVTLPWIARQFLRLRWRVALRKLLGKAVDTDLGAEFATLLRNTALSSSSMPLLGMGRDIPDGRLFLDKEGRLTTDWRIDGSRAYFEELERTARAIAAELGGTFRDSRLRRLTKLITVHSLGGCPMGRNPSEGVVDSYGQVFGYENFFIVDGSVMPGPVGPNPSLTIAALADRFADRMLGEP